MDLFEQTLAKMVKERETNIVKNYEIKITAVRIQGLSAKNQKEALALLKNIYAEHKEFDKFTFEVVKSEEIKKDRDFTCCNEMPVAKKAPAKKATKKPVAKKTTKKAA